jgi:sucrose-6F-phosphate phosphohydrolase
MIKTKSPKWLIALDIDDTLTGDKKSLERLSSMLNPKSKGQELLAVLITGRSLAQVIHGWKSEELPYANITACQLGTEIYTPPYHMHQIPDKEWEAIQAIKFNWKKVISILKNIPGITLQPSVYNTPLKVSCYIDPFVNAESVYEMVKTKINEKKHPYKIIYSKGQYLDILPSISGKGNAINYIIRRYHINHDNVIIAGDSGNDIDMFLEKFKCIAVANSSHELISFIKKSKLKSVYISSKPYAAGVQEGLRHFKVI